MRSPKLIPCAYTGATLAAAAFLVLLPFRRQAGELDDGPLVQNVSPQAFSVVWWDRPGAESELRVRGNNNVTARFSATRNGNRYEARADGLEPETTYPYELVRIDSHGNEHRLQIGRASTAKLPGSSISFLVVADSGASGRTQYRLAHVMERYPVDLILHAGDIAYPNGERHKYHRPFFSPFRKLIASTPLYPVMGNHDIESSHGSVPFTETFSLPRNGPPGVQPERCYWFDYGDARFVGIDSNLDRDTLARCVAPWLESTLNSSHRAWKVVFFHHVLWAGANRPVDDKIRDTLVPVIEASGVNVVFCGHNHFYQRTHPLLGGQLAPSNGVTYIASGAGGKSLHTERSGAVLHIAAFNDSTFSFSWVRIDGRGLRLAQISESDEFLDTMTLMK